MLTSRPPPLPRRLVAGRGSRAYVLSLVAAVIALVAYPVVRRTTRRLERVRSAMEAWGAGSLSARLVADGRDEAAAVAAALNAAASPLVECLVAAHRSLLANASHELRCCGRRSHG
ncbi:HAMP domain-containing protein [uncultured Enterovirga sp.]|uniref:HAMP domain-containing protein n=1 Tax=uncultured Enterovirga sp. TaxID=2026352 RepID=UPI0035C9D917